MKNTTILIIEDELVTAQTIQKTLEGLGYKVSAIIPTGEEAIATVENDRPDLILMDITLAGNIDGIEAAMHINKKHNIPLIYLTGNTNIGVMQKAQVETKSYGYLLKPVKGIDLHWTINTALKRHELEKRG